MTTAPDVLQEQLRRRLERRELNRLLGDGGLRGRSGLVAPRVPARKAGGVRELPIAMPEPLTSGGQVVGSAQLLVMSATGALIAPGGDHVTFDTILAQHQFGTVSNPGDSWVHPVDGVYVLIDEHEWDSYEGGGTIQVELDGTLLPEGVIADGTVGQEARGTIAYAAKAGQVGKVKVTHSAGSAQTCSATVRIAVSDPMGTGAAAIAGDVVSAGTQDSPDVTGWINEPPGWLDGEAHWIWHLDGTDRPNEEDSWMEGIYESPTARAITIEAACDNSADVYLNGALLGAVPGYLTRTTFSATLKSGTNQFAVAAHNTTASGSVNPAGFIMSVADATTGQVIFRTTDQGNWFGYATEPAGWPTP